jgi:hypothetical protein
MGDLPQGSFIVERLAVRLLVAGSAGVPADLDQTLA